MGGGHAAILTTAIQKNGRLAVFVCSLMPMLVWPLSGHKLAHPWQVLAWFMLFALLAASISARLLRLSALLQLLLLPVTLGWIGTVAATGYGPSNAAFEAATSGAIGELMTAAQLALTQTAFVICAVLTLASLAWALSATWAHWDAWRQQRPKNTLGDILFLCCLAPLASANMDVLGYPGAAQLAGQEARLSVTWLSHLGMAKALMKQAIDQAGRGPTAHRGETIRSAHNAAKLFDMQPGLAVFVVGESLRADALVQVGRGPWSQALNERLTRGLGARLRDACSGASATFDSVPRLLTAVEPGDVAGAAAQPTILASAKAAGAKTAYVINHESWVVPETGHDVMQRTSSMETVAYDDAVIEALGDFAARSGKGPKAALLHIYGQHFFYDKRYPANAFAALPDNLSADVRQERHYARAAEYGLKVLLDAAAILDAQAEPAFLVFTSDHGENLPSDHTGKKYHALPVSGKNDTTVPVLVLWNRAFADSGKSAMLAPLQGSGGLIAHRDVARAWLALAGMPGALQATPEPRTWGAASAGFPVGAIACTTLKP